MSVKAKGLYLHKAVRPDLLSFAAGDVLTVLDQSHPDWWSAELNGKTGLIPAKYVQVLESPPVAAAPAAAPAVTAPEPEGSSEEFGRGVALYDCTPPRADVLGFKKGEIIILISQSSEDWFVGEIDGRTGLVAKNYIRILPSELSRQDKSPRSGSISGNKSPRPTPQQAPASVAVPPALNRAVSTSGMAPVKQPPAAGRAPAPVIAPAALAKQPSAVTVAAAAPVAAHVAAPMAAAPQATPFAGGKPYTAIADYVGARDNVLTFSKGDLIMIIDQTRQDWWRGVLRGRTGAVPATYVRPSDAVGGSAAASGATATASTLAAKEDDSDRRGRRSTIVAAPDVAAKMRAAAEQQKKSKVGTALYAFQQQKPGVLLFKKGDLLTILDDSRIDWWKAELNGKVGMVPAKYVQLNVPGAAAAVTAAAAPAHAAAAPAVAPAAVPVQAAAPVQAPVAVAAAAPAAKVGVAPAVAAPAPVQKLVAMQFFKSPRPDILGLEPGMEMTLLGKPSPDWWKVELRGKVGLIPAKLVQPLVRPADAAPTGNSSAPMVDSAATIRTQKAQQMAAASAVAQGRAPGVVAPVVSGGAAQLHAFTPSVGDTVEALIGVNWQRVMVVGTQDEGYLVSASEGSPQIYVQKVRKAYGSAAVSATPQEDLRANLKHSAAAPVAAPVVAPIVAPVAAPVVVKTAPPAAAPAAVPPVKVVAPTAHQPAAPTVAPVSPRKPVPVTPVAAAVVPQPLPAVQAPPSVVPAVDDFESVRQEAKRRAEGSLSNSLTQGSNFLAMQALDLGAMSVTIADLDRALASAGVDSPAEESHEPEQLQSVSGGEAVGSFRVGQSVEALFSGSDDWYAATVLEVKKAVVSGEIKYLVRYDEYGNEKLLSAVSLRSVEAPPEVADIVVKDMKYGVGATIEAQYAEDGEWYVAQIKAHTPEGNYFVTFVEYGNFQECTPAQVRDLTVPLEEVLPLINEVPPGGFNLRFKVGDSILARYLEDGLFYEAQVKGITPMGTYWVVFTEYGNEQEAAEADVAPPQ